MSGFLWCQEFPGISIFLMSGSLVSGFLWYQHFPDASISLVSGFLWYQHSSGISAGLSVDLPLLLDSRALGASFDKPANTRYFVLHRTFKDTVSFGEL